MTYSGSAFSGAPYSGEGESVEPGEPITPLPVESAQDVPGPPWGNALTPLPVESAQVVNAPVTPPTPDLLNPLTPAPVDSAQAVPGPTALTITPGVPEVPVGSGSASVELVVAGYPDALSFSCQPQLNEVGVGEVVIQREPGAMLVGEIVGFNLLGTRIFTGRVTNRIDTLHDQGEEATQTLAVTVEGMLSEWEYAIVYPDFGAQDPSRIGAPTQDIRNFDWTMNGLGSDSAEGVAGVNIIDSVGMTNRYGQSNELFPLPDVWPAPYAQWMWIADPSRVQQPEGWVYFREPFGTVAGKMQVWCCAYDYAEVWVDGVPLLTCDQPGVAQHVEIEVRDDFHLITIRAHNGGGKAGVLAAVIPVDEDTGLYGEPYRTSRGGWKALGVSGGYTTEDTERTFRLNPGQVLRRLRLEARRRGVRDFDKWEFDFNETYDSAGRPWPPGEPFAFEVGMTYLDVLRRMAEDRVDFAASPSGRRLRMWVKGEGTSIDHDPNPWDDDQYESVVRQQTVR